MVSISILGGGNGLSTPKNGQIATKNLKIGLKLAILRAFY